MLGAWGPGGELFAFREVQSLPPLPERNGAAGSPALWHDAEWGQAAVVGEGGRAAACREELLEKILPWVGSGGAGPIPRDCRGPAPIPPQHEPGLPCPALRADAVGSLARGQ